MKKVVVITGASGGIGLATAKLFAKKGDTVYGISRTARRDGEFFCYSADVTNHARIEEIFREIYEKEGRIDVLVNNAGMGIAGAMEEASPERIEQIIGVNLTALCVLSGKIVPYMKEGGRIINISSVGGIMPLPYQAMYSATKAGAEVFSRALDSELRARKIRVTAILPGDTKTGFTAARICEGGNERAKKSVAKMSRDEQRGKPPESVAKAVYRVSNQKRPPLRKTVGFVSKAEVFLSRFLPVRLLNFLIRKIYG